MEVLLRSANVVKVRADHVELVEVQLGNTVIGESVAYLIKSNGQAAMRYALLAAGGNGGEKIIRRMDRGVVDRENVAKAEATAPAGSLGSRGARLAVDDARTVACLVVLEGKARGRVVTL